MIKYFDELDKKKEFYLPLADKKDNGLKGIYNFSIPVTFVEKYSNLFKNSESLITVYKNFDIDKWFDENMYINYSNACDIHSEFESISEDMYFILENYKKIDVTSRSIEFYFKLIERISFLFIDLFPKNKKYYENINHTLKQALKELKDMCTISYIPNKIDNVQQPDAWFITPNGYLYNPGNDGHKSRDLTFSYNRIKHNIMNNEQLKEIKKSSKNYLKIAYDIKERNYITAGQFKVYLNYVSQPAYLDSINGIPITREKHIVDTVVGMLMAHACFYDFFKEFIDYIENPQEEMKKLSKLTNNDINDILVRCCGFHKVESCVDKTITTSCINYEIVFEEYIKRGWTIQFISPIIINKEHKIIEEYPNEFLTIRKILKLTK